MIEHNGKIDINAIKSVHLDLITSKVLELEGKKFNKKQLQDELNNMYADFGFSSAEETTQLQPATREQTATVRTALFRLQRRASSALSEKMTFIFMSAKTTTETGSTPSAHVSSLSL